MIAVDMDWTLLDAEKHIPKEVFEGFKRITLSGGYVVIATGRGKESASEVFSENSYALGRDDYPHAIAVANKIFYLKDGEYVSDEVWNIEVEKWWAKSKPLAKKIIDEIVLELDEYRYERTWDCGIAFGSQEDAIQVQEIITQYMMKNEIHSILLERNGWSIALNDARLGKGHCLERIIRKMSLKPEEVIAIGDSNNDRSMLDGQIGFFPACPANADEEIIKLVRAKGGIVAKQNYGWGVVEIMNRTLSI